MSDQSRFDGYTKLLRQSFPSWSKIRKDDSSIGAQFLSVIGVQLDEMEWMLNYAEQQYHIGTADLNQTDLIYKALLPDSLTPSLRYQFSSNSHILSTVSTVEEFLLVPRLPAHLPETYFDTRCYIDFTGKYIYVKHPYGADDQYPEGQLMLTLFDQAGLEIWSDPIPLMMHHVWNFFDEFGLLLDTPRLYGEKNAVYKERLLDVFRRPASSTYRGLLNGIARELGLIYEVEWDNGESDLTLYHSRIDSDSIYVDDSLIDDESFIRDASGRIILKGSEYEAGNRRTVRYIAGVSLHELHDASDTAFQEELYRVDGTASERLDYYAQSIRDHVPIMWGQWKWNQGLWNTSEASMVGYGALPTLYDANFTGWKKYRPKGG